MSFVERVRKYAEDHYNDGGWDVIVECWDDAEIARVLDDVEGDEAKAWEIIDSLVDIWADRQADAINSAF
jgi:hypothetical protein